MTLSARSNNLVGGWNGLFYFNLSNINMSKSILELLFDSRPRVKILKFLFRNAMTAFGAKEMSNRVQERPAVVRKEIKKLLEIGLLRQKGKT